MADAADYVKDVQKRMQLPCETCHLRFICSPNMWRQVDGGEEFQLTLCNLFTNVPEEVRTLATVQFSNQMCADASWACSSCSAAFRI